MSGQSLHILLIEDSLAEARFLQEILKGALLGHCCLVHVTRLQDAIAKLQELPFQVILLDLTLPDSHGLASLDTLVNRAPNLPIVVLTNTNDDQLALEAVRQGAQDYLVKRLVNGELLARSLRYAIERKQVEEALREANEVLEVRVGQRTADLANANELLQLEIDRRQQVQERLELAQKAGKIGTFDWDIATQQITWTTELEALYGLEPGDLGNQHYNWLEMLHPDDRLPTEQALWHSVQEGTELNIEFRAICPTGEIRWITAKGCVLPSAAGGSRMLGVHIDITEKKQLESQFLRAQRLESIGTLASGIAHDLNNIFTPVLGISQLLQLKLANLSASNQRLLEILELNAKRGADLVKQILSFARGVEGKRLPLQVSHVIHEVEQIIQQTCLKSIEIQTEIAPDLGMVSADATQLHQVLMNLCVNARDAMPMGGVLSMAAQTMWVDEAIARLHLDAKIGSYIEITVTDTGVGIPPDILHRIFDPFFTTKEIGKGTGLGLSAVLGIVKSHGGFVDVQSQPGVGTEFKVYLPIDQSTDVLHEIEVDLLDGQGELVLIVDDEPTICEVTRTTLEVYNYRALTAHNGVEAIALYAQHHNEINSVLMDMRMPTMDGCSTIAALKRLNPHVYVIAMSGLASREIVTQARYIGFEDFLFKPFTATELIQTLSHARTNHVSYHQASSLPAGQHSANWSDSNLR